MASYADLVIEVRAQIDCSPEQARSWLVDRARLLNAESAWNLVSTGQTASEGAGKWPLPDDCLWVEAVFVDETVYSRSTAKVLDRTATGWSGIPIYGQETDAVGTDLIELFPAVETGQLITIRYVADLKSDAVAPPFPSDFDSSIVDGAIAIGLARMDERFDSANYFDARFVDAVSRLRRRRHGRYGRGATAIPVIQ